jgi:hypothetical protein
MDRLCSEMDSVRQENVQLHARIAQLEKHAPSTVEVEVQRDEAAAIEAEAQRRYQEMKDEEMARELAELWSSSGDVEQHQRERAASPPSSIAGPAQGRVSPKEAAAAAAEARAQKAAPTAAAKAEIIGRLQEIYKRQGKEAHWALGSYSLPRLKELLKEQMQKRHTYMANQVALAAARQSWGQ